MFTSVKSYNGTSHSASQVSSYSPSAIASIINFHTGHRTMYWRVDLLHSDLTYKDDLTRFTTKFVCSGDTTRAIGRTLDLDMVETVASQTVGGTLSIDYLQDRVQPVCLIQKASNEWLAFPLGVFLFKRPGVVVPGYAIVRHASLTDHTAVIQESAATAITSNGVGLPLTLPPGEKVIDVIRSLIINSPTNVPSNPATLANLPGCALDNYMPSNVPGAPGGNTPGDWPSSITAKIPGTAGGTDGGYTTTEGQNYLDLINHLLFTIGCYNLQCDERGIFRVQQWPLSGTPPLPDYTGLSSLYTYDTTSDSIITFGLTEDLNIDDVPNVVQVRVEDVSRATFMATATNNDPGSPFSVANYGGTGRRVVKIISDGQVPASASGENWAGMYAKQQLLIHSWLTDTVTLPIAVNPLHCGYLDHDVISLNIYQQFYSDGSAEDVPVIVSGDLNGIVVTEKFIVDGWQITANLATPGSGTNLTGNIGLTTVLEPRESKQGNTMTLTCHRITSTVNSAFVTVS